MIVTRLMGGLGNQMFQWAAARALALRHGVDARVDLSYLQYSRHATTRGRYQLTCFAVEPPVATLDDLKWLRHERPSGLRSRARDTVKTLLRPGRLELVQQRGLDFDPRIFSAPARTLLLGYWQSERYFTDAEPAIRADFAFRDPLGGRDAEVAVRLGDCESVAVHVRRGDYVTDARTNAFHGVLTPEWYEAAFAEVARRVARPVAFVFSDDPGWCREHLRLPVRTHVVDHNPPERPAGDLRLMTLCKHHVVANSSFSWWGAWLAARDDGVVVAPRSWFRDPAIDTDDLTPADWLRV